MVTNKRIGTLRVNTFEEKQIEDAVKKALNIARVTPPNKDFKSLSEPLKWTPIERAFDPKTEGCIPEYRAEKSKNRYSRLTQSLRL